jgi:hypothetical protein
MTHRVVFDKLLSIIIHRQKKIFSVPLSFQRTVRTFYIIIRNMNFESDFSLLSSSNILNSIEQNQKGLNQFIRYGSILVRHVMKRFLILNIIFTVRNYHRTVL